MLAKCNCRLSTDSLSYPWNQLKIFKIGDPLWYRSGVNELDMFLEMLLSNIVSHKHWFPRGDPDQVKYALPVLEQINIHHASNQHWIQCMNQSEWPIQWPKANYAYWENFDLIVNNLQMMYGENIRCHIWVNTALQGYQQLPSKPVSRYANYWKTQWQRGGCSLLLHQGVSYNMAGVEWQHTHKINIRSWITWWKHRVYRLNQQFHNVADLQPKWKI